MSRHLGFHNLPYMAHRKSMKKGFRFTLMVVGKEKSAVRMKEEMYIITTLQVSLVLANPLWYSHFLAVRLLHLLVILESLFLFLFLIFYSSFIYFLYIFSLSPLAGIHSIKPTTTIETVTADIEPFDDPRGVKMKLTVIDTPGFGESIDSSDWYIWYIHM